MKFFASLIIEIFLRASAFVSSFKIKNPFLNMILQIIYLVFVSLVPTFIISMLVIFFHGDSRIDIENVQFAIIILMLIVVLCIAINNFDSKRTPANYIFIATILVVILINNKKKINKFKWITIFRGVFFILCWLGILLSLLFLVERGLYITITDEIGMPFVCISFLLTYYLCTYTTFEKNKQLNRKVLMEVLILLAWVVLSLYQIINFFQNKTKVSFLDISIILLGIILTFSAITDLINYFSVQIWKKNKALVLRSYVIVREKYSYLIIKKYFINRMEIGKECFGLLCKAFQEKKFKKIFRFFRTIAISIFAFIIYFKIIFTDFDFIPNYINNWNIKLSPFFSDFIVRVLMLISFIALLFYSFKKGIKLIKRLENFEKIKNVIDFIIVESLLMYMIYKMGYQIISSL